MKAIGKLHKRPGLWLYDAPMPQMGPDDLLIKVKKTSFCGTDLHIYDWDEWAEKTIPVPMTTGHEFYGTVADIGKNVKGFSKGDRVSGEGHIVCGHCRFCHSGTFHLCPNTQGLGVNRPGCFAEYLVLPAFNAFKIPPEIPDDVATILDPLGNAAHTALSFDLVGEDVLITGAGSIGLMAALIAKKVGAHKIVVTDVNEKRLELARSLGVTKAVNTKKQKLSEVMQELHIDEGFRVGFEMSGAQSALDEMIEVMSPGGQIALLGILPSKTTVDATKIIFKSLYLKGIYGREMFKTWHKVIALLQEGLDVTPLITHTFSPEEFETAIQAMKSKEAEKVILNWA